MGQIIWFLTQKYFIVKLYGYSLHQLKHLTLLHYFYSLQHLCLLGCFMKDLRTPKLCKFSWYFTTMYLDFTFES